MKKTDFISKFFIFTLTDSVQYLTTLITNLVFQEYMPIVFSLIKSIKNIFGECNSMNTIFFYKRLVLSTRKSRCSSDHLYDRFNFVEF